MTDLATTLATLAAHVDRVGVTNADVLRVDVCGGVLTIQLKDEAAPRLVPSHGDEDGHSVRDYTAPTGVKTHHHRVPVKGTDGKVVLLWITDEVVAQAA